MLIPLLIAVAGMLAVGAGWRARITRSQEGKILAFLVLLVGPVAATWSGFSAQMKNATSTGFCLSCHVMSEHGRSLRVDDPSYLAARHFQNHLVPPDRACYTCHTDYAMFGTLTAKIRGARHLAVQYFGTIPRPGQIKLYQPYNNRECLHCHSGARRFEEAAPHNKTADLRSRVKTGQLSCLSSGCHDIVHDVGSLKDATLWKGEPQ